MSYESDFSRLTDQELFDALYVHTSDYTLAALEIAREEFLRRGLHPDDFAPKQEAVPASIPPGSPSTLFSDSMGIVRGCMQILLNVVFVMFLCCLGVYGIYKWADSKGYMQHRILTTITVGNDWLTGESKECWSLILDYKAAEVLKDNVGSAFAFVNCGESTERKMSVAFYGREIQTEHKIAMWRCERKQPSFLNDDAFCCYQTGGQ